MLEYTCITYLSDRYTRESAVIVPSTSSTSGFGRGNWNLTACGTTFVGLNSGVAPLSYVSMFTNGLSGEYSGATVGTTVAVVTFGVFRGLPLPLFAGCVVLCALPLPLFAGCALLGGRPLLADIPWTSTLTEKLLTLTQGVGTNDGWKRQLSTNRKRP